ncbi:MAG: hypothetical protein ACWA44_05140 [Thiotrichales bacterium]
MLINTAEILEQRKLYNRMPGVSFGNLCFGFMPAFKDFDTGETHLSINSDGSIALIHSLDNLPLDWVTGWDDKGRATELKETVGAGFVRGIEFYTLADLEEFDCDD